MNAFKHHSFNVTDPAGVELTVIEEAHFKTVQDAVVDDFVSYLFFNYRITVPDYAVKEYKRWE